MSAPMNPPAFPLAVPAGYEFADGGMSLRDWFAGQALSGMMGNADMPFAADAADVEPRQIAEAAYELADAMLAECAKGGAA